MASSCGGNFRLVQCWEKVVFYTKMEEAGNAMTAVVELCDVAVAEARRLIKATQPPVASADSSGFRPGKLVYTQEGSVRLIAIDEPPPVPEEKSKKASKATTPTSLSLTETTAGRRLLTVGHTQTFCLEDTTHLFRLALTLTETGDIQKIDINGSSYLL